MRCKVVADNVRPENSHASIIPDVFHFGKIIPVLGTVMSANWNPFPMIARGRIVSVRDRLIIPAPKFVHYRQVRFVNYIGAF